jgi:hypothetical protein
MGSMIIFVGDKPSTRMKPGANPFEGAACETRLRIWILKILTYSYVDHVVLGKPMHSYHIVNQCDFTTLRLMLMDGIFIALGNNASKALKKANKPHFKLPHPSGRNRQVNDKAFIASKLNECKKYVDSHLDSKV